MQTKSYTYRTASGVPWPIESAQLRARSLLDCEHLVGAFHGPRANGEALGANDGLHAWTIAALRKGLDDIRLLRATDPRIASQMLDLSPYRKVSSMPPVRRDLSIVVGEAATAEALGDQVRGALGDRADAIEAVEVVSETPYDALPPPARARLALRREQKNVLLRRVVLRDVSRTLTHAEANELRDAIYAAVHEGERMEWAARGVG